MLTLFDLRRESVGLGFSVNSVRPEEGECGVRFYC